MIPVLQKKEFYVYTEKVNPVVFKKLLDSNATERQLHSYIMQHPWILYWTLCPASGHSRFVLPSFPLGTRYKTDFVILNSYSGAYEVHFVELEPSSDQSFTKAGRPSQRLASAIKQIDDWRSFFESNQHDVRSTLVRWAKRKDVLGYHPKCEPFNYWGQYLHEPDTPLRDRYLIIIGRSSTQSPDTRNLVGRFGNGHSVQIMSYDRLLLLAERRYGHRKK